VIRNKYNRKNKNFYSISDKSKKIYFKANDCWIDSSIWIKIADDKELTYIVAEENNIKIPKTIYLDRKDLDDFNFNKIKITYPIVSKPVNWAHWDWVALNITNKEELKKGILYSFQNKNTTKIVIQEQIKGDDYRLIIIWWKFIAASKRIPPSVVWNWTSTILELIEEENNQQWVSQKDHDWIKNKITIDKEAEKCIATKWYSLNSILKKWEKIFVRDNWNLSTWWISVDVTDIVHQEVIDEAIRFSNILWLGLSWVDIMSKDISQSLMETNGAIIEINNTPWLKMHHFPSKWKPRNVAKALLNYIFKN